MIRRIRHTEINGGYTGRRKIIVDACELFPGKYSVMTLYEGGEELEEVEPTTESEAIKEYNRMMEKYLNPMQKAVFTSSLTPGNKYTLFYLNEFGFPVCEKITLEGIEYTTWAQFADVVKLVFKPYRKRKLYQKYFYDQSFSIFEGWQDLREEDTKIVLKDNDQVRMTRSKYTCFSANYIKDGNALLKNPVLKYENFKTGVNGKIYA